MLLQGVDGVDAGREVSVAELDVHLHTVLSGVRVCDWVRHGLGLPQYAEAFRQHAVSALDFPTLLHDNARVLEEEFGVRCTRSVLGCGGVGVRELWLAPVATCVSQLCRSIGVDAVMCRRPTKAEQWTCATPSRAGDEPLPEVKSGSRDKTANSGSWKASIRAPGKQVKDLSA